jgi:hypothetical protein
MEAELPAERRGSSPCRLWRWPKGPGLTRVGPSETMIIGCRGHPSALLSTLTTGGDVPPPLPEGWALHRLRRTTPAGPHACLAGRRSTKHKPLSPNRLDPNNVPPLNNFRASNLDLQFLARSRACSPRPEELSLLRPVLHRLCRHERSRSCIPLESQRTHQRYLPIPPGPQQD